MAKLTGADYLLLLLYCDNQAPIMGAVRLTKMMFIFNEEIAPALKKIGLDSERLPEFIAYNYGPFSKDVYEQVELFKSIKFITVTDEWAKEDLGEADDWEETEYIDETFDSEKFTLEKDNRYYKYKLSTLGESYVNEKISPLLAQSQMELLEKFKHKIITMPPKQLLHYVYTKYPKFTENSLIKDEVLGDE